MPKTKVQPITSPVRTLDIHTNLRFEVGDQVKMLDFNEPELFGEVVGHVSRDRVWVQWPGNISQEDVDDLIGESEWAYTPVPKSTKSGTKKKASVNVKAGEDDGYVDWLTSLGPDDDTPEADAANYTEEVLYPDEEEALSHEACPGCGSMPGDGITDGCDDPNGCGENRLHASTLVASRRQKGIQALRIQAALIRASDLPEEADLIQAAAEVAASIHELEASPETREAASDEVAVTAMKEAIKSTIEATDSLATKGHTDVASSVTVNLEAALTYPRIAAKRVADTMPKTRVVNDITLNVGMASDENLVDLYNQIFKRKIQPGPLKGMFHHIQ